VGGLDIAILIVYFSLSLGVAWWFGRGQSDMKSFVVGNRSVPWIAVMLSILATEISAATFIGVASIGFSENWNYVQFGFGSICGRLLIAFLFLPVFYKFNCLSIYEFLAKRFGEASRYSAVLCFFVTRLMASGVRLLIASIGLAVVFSSLVEGLSYEKAQVIAILVLAAIAMLYTTFGGIKAVIWTDVLQAIIFLGGGAVAVTYLITHIDGGIAAIWQTASEASPSRTEIFRFSIAEGKTFWSDANLFYIAFLNGLIGTFAALGTDQDLTQRMLTCKNHRESQRSLILTGFLSLPVVMVFLFIGTSLYSYYLNSPELLEGLTKNDQIFPHFIINQLPVGLKGLLIAGMLAAAMSSVDSALGALSASAIVDVYRPLIYKGGSERHYLMVTRILVVGFGLMLAAIAYILLPHDNLLWLCFQIGGVTYGALLGVFLLGVLLPRHMGNNWGNMIGMLVSVCVTAPMLVFIKRGNINIGWTWLIIIGTALTFFIGLLSALLYSDAPVLSEEEQV
jgi:solute:Na+ symporter, SSS family